jgi:hypothetical protein
LLSEVEILHRLSNWFWPGSGKLFLIRDDLLERAFEPRHAADFGLAQFA